jgi:hypothetical protein
MKKLLTTLAIAGVTALALSAAPSPDYKALCAHLPDLGGWQAEKCDGISMAGPMGEVVMASRTYRKGDETMQVTVVSGMQATMAWSQFATGMTMENDEMLMKVETIDGFEVGISYDKPNRSGGVTVKLAPNAILAVVFEGMDWKEALEAAKKMDWEALAAPFRQ